MKILTPKSVFHYTVEVNLNYLGSCEKLTTYSVINCFVIYEVNV